METHFEHAACHEPGPKHGCTVIRGSNSCCTAELFPMTISLLLETVRCLRFVIPPPRTTTTNLFATGGQTGHTLPADRLFKRVCAHTHGSCRTCREQIGRFLRVAQRARSIACKKNACATFHTYPKAFPRRLRVNSNHDTESKLGIFGQIGHVYASSFVRQDLHGIWRAPLHALAR